MKIYINYSDPDFGPVNKIIDQLESDQHIVYGKMADARPEDNAAIFFEQAWRDAEIVIIVFSANSLRGSILQEDQLETLEKNRLISGAQIIVVRLDQTRVPSLLTAFLRLDFGGRFTEGLGELRAWLKNDAAKSRDSTVKSKVDDEDPPAVAAHNRIDSNSAARLAVVPSVARRQRSSNADHLIILVHGANTEALWTGFVEPQLKAAGYRVGRTTYGRNIRCLLSPSNSPRIAARERVVRDIREARRLHKEQFGELPRHLSVISHSFGCYIICETLLKDPDIEWDRIIFCGSIVRDDFPFELVGRQFRRPLLNLIGTRDYWPALAKWMSKRYGSSGSTGLNRPGVTNHWYHGLGHSGFLTAEFCNAVFVPFLQGTQWNEGGEPEKMPRWLRVTLSIPPMLWLLFLVAAIGISLAIRYV